jgi:hypothetical protein
MIILTSYNCLTPPPTPTPPLIIWFLEEGGNDPNHPPLLILHEAPEHTSSFFVSHPNQKVIE